MRTERLNLRVIAAEDLDAFHAYRSDPEIAKQQLWEMPYPRAEAERMIASFDGQADVRPGGWTQIAILLDGQMIGDVAVHLDETGKVAEIGYTLARAYHGNGYATEAAGAVTDALFAEFDLIRLYGELDPPNVASQRVLEAIGLRFESLTKRSFLWRGEWTDNLCYRATADEYAAWKQRQLDPPEQVELVELDAHNVPTFAALETHYSQRRFVSPMPKTLGELLVPRQAHGRQAKPWYRGVLADGEAAGFVLLDDGARWPRRETILWRLLIDRMHQRRGIGEAIVAQLADRCRHRRERRLLTTWKDGPGSPAHFYARLGFVPTGERWGEQTVAALAL